MGVLSPQFGRDLIPTPQLETLVIKLFKFC